MLEVLSSREGPLRNRSLLGLYGRDRRWLKAPRVSPPTATVAFYLGKKVLWHFLQ